MTKQEIFDKIALHLLRQNKKSVNKSGFCAYRGTNGLKCAAGCLIDDLEYKPEMEIHNFGMVFTTDNGINVFDELLKNKPYLYDNLELIKTLQRIHDNHNVCEWKEELNYLAKRQNLLGIP